MKKVRVEEEKESLFLSVFKKYPAETILISIAVLITLITLVMYFKGGNGDPQNNYMSIEKPSPKIYKKTTVRTDSFVDVSGAVMQPNIYRIRARTRLKDVLIMAGGLSADADRDFFYRNFNLASYVYDQEKIYIPHNYEVWRKIFTEPKRVVNFTKPVEINSKNNIINDQPATDKISINTATFSELDSLPGIGPTTAQKIISNRPYSSIKELLTKKIVSKSVFEKIKGKIKE